MSTASLYQRLGGYDAIAAVADALMTRLKKDEQLRRFYDHRGTNGIEREQQLLIDFLCESSGGPMIYTGRDLRSSHIGMGLNEEDWKRAMHHLSSTLDTFNVPAAEKEELMSFHNHLKREIVHEQA
ncbi:MAG: group I truncated hemoglobin [Pseudomonadales bacterium]